MVLPFFYLSSYEPGAKEIDLDEDNSRHIVQVLRMQAGDPLQLTDGRGNLLQAVIAEAHKKKCRVQVTAATFHPRREKEVTIAISLLKNATRFEWFLEKATEMGVTGIIPLLCQRTERSHFRQDRMQNILVSAMLQSQQAWLPDLRPPTPFQDLVAGAPPGRRLIAHCLEEQRMSLAETGNGNAGSLILIGPEGDFTKEEIGDALQQGFRPVILGETRLRTETAGVVAAALLCIG